MTDDQPGMTRRTTLATASGAFLAAALGNGSTALAATSATPILATPDQIEAEKLLLEMLRDPDLPVVQARLKAEILASPQGQSADARATLDRAIVEWTNSLILKQIALYRPTPALLYGTDDTPRTWLGHTIDGVGTSGDNPDKIYRIGYCDGDGAYEILGQFAAEGRAAQLIIDIATGGPVPERPEPNAPKTTVSPLIATILDRDLVVSADGRFRITMGGKADSPNHVDLRPGTVSFGSRDVLSDWSQHPCRMTVRRRDGVAPKPFDKAELRRRILADLPAYIRFWAPFPVTWMGGLGPNAVAQPIGREGGWGFVGGLRFQLKPGEVLLLTTGRNGAAYTGIQINDPWMIQPDVRKWQASLNVSQATPNADGTYTYAIGPEDPGLANWLDTAGLHEGVAIMRWQVMPPGATKDGLIRDHRVTSLADARALPDVPRVTPAQRRAALARRKSYENRLV